jgi:hypothetical protein
MQPDKLLCEECARESDWGDVFTHMGDPRWGAYLSIDNEAVIYCPECAEREFGGSEDSQQAA